MFQFYLNLFLKPFFFAFFSCISIVGFPDVLHNRHDAQEIVYAATDRDYFVAGEMMNFQISYYTRPDTLSLKSRYVYVALRNTENVVAKEVLELDNHSAHGRIILSDTLSTGYYEMLVFTRWMHNFGEETFFRKQIFIANRFDDDLDALEEPYANKDMELNVYSEGGNWVTGQKNKFLIKTNNAEASSPRQYFVIDSLTQDTLLQNRLNHHGFGSFSLDVSDNDTYLLSLEGNEKLYPLLHGPKADISFTLDQKQDELAVRFFYDTLQLSRLNADFSVYSDDKVVYNQKINCEDKTCVLTIPKRDLPHGYLSFVLSNRKNRSERKWYNQPDKGIELIADSLIKVRTPALLRLKSEMQELARLAITVVPENALNPTRVKVSAQKRAFNIHNTFPVSDDEFHLLQRLSINDLNEYLIAPLDLSDRKAPGKPSSVFHEMETEGRIIKGRIRDENTDSVVAGARVFLNIADEQVNLQYAYTDQQGVFNFVLDDYYNGKNLFFTMDTSTVEENATLEILDLFDFRSTFNPKPFLNARQARPFIDQTREIVGVLKAYGFYSASTANSIIPESERSEKEKEISSNKKNPYALYSKANYIIRPGEFIPLNNMLEISKELIPLWKFYQKNNTYKHRLLSEVTGKSLPGKPVFFIDGIIESDEEKFVHLNSLQIKEIAIHNYQWVYGDLVFPGIIAIFSHDSEYEKIFTDETKTIYPNLITHELMHPVYPDKKMTDSGNDTRIPFINPTLYWNPSVKLTNDKDVELEWYSGDLSGNYKVIIEGIDADESGIYIESNFAIH